MTNGEKIQQDFECEACEPIIEDNIIHVIFADKPHSAIGFDWDWWNAEYQRANEIVITDEAWDDLPVESIEKLLMAWRDNPVHVVSYNEQLVKGANIEEKRKG